MSDGWVLEDSGFRGYMPDGAEYLVEVTDARRVVTQWTDDMGNPQVKVRFIFKVISDDDFNGTEVFGETNETFRNHPNCRLYAWTETLLGQRLPTGFVLPRKGDVAPTLIGKRAFATMMLGTKKNGENFNKVRDIKPIASAAQALSSTPKLDDYEQF